MTKNELTVVELTRELLSKFKVAATWQTTLNTLISI